MEIFNPDAFLKQIEEIEESSLKAVPEGMEEEDFLLMWQVLTARKPSELEHISNEQLMAMFYYVDDVASVIEKRSTYFDCSDSDSGSYRFIGTVKQLPSASSSRRVL